MRTKSNYIISLRDSGFALPTPTALRIDAGNVGAVTIGASVTSNVVDGSTIERLPSALPHSAAGSGELG
ncbi:MAG: hypothetical protein ABSD53_05150 [Terriglobales bacterium]